MARKRYAIPQYGTVIMAGKEYYRTRIGDADGKRVALYGRTRNYMIRCSKRESRLRIIHFADHPPQ